MAYGKTKIKLERKAEQIAEIKKCGSDPVYFIKKYVKISHPIRGPIPFQTYPYQDDCVADFLKYRLVICNKSRQLGLSTIAAAYCLWMALFRREKNIIVIATKLDTAKLFLRKVKGMLDSLPEWLVMPSLTADTVKELRFSNGSIIKAMPTSQDVARGESSSLLIIDECAHIEDFDELWTGIQPSLSTGGACILLSTPKGVGNQFYNIWKSATDIVGPNEERKVGSNGFWAIELPWMVHPEHDQAWFDQQCASLLHNPRAISQELLCLEGNTRIITPGGYKFISELSLGDLVLTHKGRFRKVTKTFQHLLDVGRENLYEVSTPGLRTTPIRITSNHPICGVFYKVPYRGSPTETLKKNFKASELVFSSIDEIKQNTNLSNRKFSALCFPQGNASEAISNSLTEIDIGGRVGFLSDIQYTPIDVNNEYPNGVEVYNIEVEEDNSYVADNLGVHNCSFQASGFSFLDTESMGFLASTVESPIARYGQNLEMNIWRYAEHGHKYIVAGDVARGDAEDFSAFHVVDVSSDPQQVVAEFKGKIQPDKFADFLVEVAEKYNKAFIVHEMNSAGIVTSYRLKQLKYPHLFYDDLFYKKRNLEATYTDLEIGDLLPGFTTTTKSRPDILAKMEGAIRNRKLLCRSKRLLDEFRTFVVISDKPKAQKGHNDDLVLSLAISCNFLEFGQTVEYDGSVEMAILKGMSRNSKTLEDLTPRAFGVQGSDFPVRQGWGVNTPQDNIAIYQSLDWLLRDK